MFPSLVFDTTPLPQRQRVLLCGVGSMGRRHAKMLLSHPAVESLTVLDPHAEMPGARALHDSELEAACGDIDLAIVASPTGTHASLAGRLVTCGIPCLIEKPMTVSLVEHARLERLAADQGVPLAVGFIERFNPAMVAARPLFQAHRWDLVRFSRFNPGSIRLAHESLIGDVMVHDIDLALNVLGETCDGDIDVQATGMSIDRADYVVAILRGERTPRVEFCSGRVPGPVVRQVEASGPHGDLLVDLLRRRFYFSPKGDGIGLVSGTESHGPAGNLLRVQFEDFLRLVAHGRRQAIAVSAESHRVQHLVERIERQVDAALANRAITSTTISVQRTVPTYTDDT